MKGDAALLRCYVEERSEAAFGELVGRHLNLVYFAALRRTGGNSHLAEEIAQEVFTALAWQAASLSRHATLVGWLYTTTRFTAAKTMRTEQRRQTREQEAQLMHDISTAAGAQADWEKLRPVLDAVLDELNERDREAVLLRCLEGRAFAEIGATLRLTEDAARMRVERALEKLRALLARRGVTSTSAALGAILTGEAARAAPVGLAASVTGSAVTTAATMATGPVAGLIQFMSTSKIAVGAAVLVLIGTGGTAAYEVHSRQRERAALMAERQEIFLLARRVEDVERQAKDAARSSGGATRAKEAAAPAMATSNLPSSKKMKALELGRSIMAAYPEIQPLIAADRRGFWAAHYRKLYQELGLNAAQIEALEKIKIAGITYSIEGMEPERPDMAFEAAPPLSAEEKAARLKELLGERGYRRMEDVDSSPDDYQVVRLAGMLYYTDAPLTAEQGERFQEVLAACNRAAGPAQSPSEYWAAVRRRAGGFLSMPQLAALDTFQAADEFGVASSRAKVPQAEAAK